MRAIPVLCFVTYGLSAACSSGEPNPSDAPGGSAATSAGSAAVAGTSSSQAGTSAVSTGGSSENTSGSGSIAGNGNAAGTGAGGMSPTAGAGGSGTSGSSAGGSGTGGTGPANPALEKFSFFLTSLASVRKVSGNEEGFGGDLRFGETGENAGLKGADKICKAIAELGMPGAGAKDWRAFLSTTAGGPNGGPIHAKTRIGNGPWYDALGRIVAKDLPSLIGSDRPAGADPAIKDDLPNEFGIPNHTADAPGCTGGACPDNHQVLTGTNCSGELYTGSGSGGGGFGGGVTPTCSGITQTSGTPDPKYTCNDWTSSAPEGSPWCGHSWPRQGSGLSWMSAAQDGGCAPCVRLVEMGGVNDKCVGSAGGYGGFYCFEYKP